MLQTLPDLKRDLEEDVTEIRNMDSEEEKDEDGDNFNVFLTGRINKLHILAIV